MADINVIVLPDGTEYPVSDYYIPVAISNPTDGQVLKYDATNDVWYNGDDAEGSSVFYGTSAPTSQLGVNGNLYVKYTEGTGGASDTVDSLYVKLDGSWCQISTGGGGGTSDYNDLTNKPQINSVELSGNKSLDDLGIQPSEISKTASGSIASFTDGGDDIPVSEYECEIVAQQASGTPTPDNPLPITGFSQADITVTDNDQITNLYTVAFGQTIYGGRLIYKDGQWSIEATHGIKDLGNLGNTDWSYDSDSGRFYYAYAITDSKHYSASELPNAICSCYPMVKRNDLADKTITVVWNGSVNYVLAMDSDYTNVNDFKTAITGQKIVYELATPVIIPITSSTRVKTISGVNNIYSNTGDNSVKYFTENADEIAELVKAEIASTNTDYHEYSTEEKIVGKWIDGSTIYEKTFIAQVTSTAYTIDVSALNIDEVISNTAFIKQTSGNVVTAPYATSNTDYAISYYGSNLIKFSYAGAWNTATWCVTIRYTKTTSNTRSLNLSKGLSDETKSEEPVEEKKSEEVDLKLTEKTEEEES